MLDFIAALIKGGLNLSVFGTSQNHTANVRQMIMWILCAFQLLFYSLISQPQHYFNRISTVWDVIRNFCFLSMHDYLYWNCCYCWSLEALELLRTLHIIYTVICELVVGVLLGSWRYWKKFSYYKTLHT